jgi:hypothetical protein
MNNVESARRIEVRFMSRVRQDYKGRIVEVTSIPLRDGGFTAHFDLERHAGNHIDVTHFESGQRLNTDEEALATGIRLGQHQIDVGYEVDTPVVNQ